MSGLDLVISIAIDPPPIKGSLYSEIVLGNQGDNVFIALDFPPGSVSYTHLTLPTSDLV